MYHSTGASPFTMLCSQPLYQVPKHFHHLKRSNYTSFLPFSGSWQPPLCLLSLCACGPSCFFQVRLFKISWSVARQAPLSMRVFRQEYWSGLPCPPPGDLPNPGLEPTSPVAPALQVDSFLLNHWGSPSLSTDLPILNISFL